MTATLMETQIVDPLTNNLGVQSIHANGSNGEMPHTMEEVMKHAAFVHMPKVGDLVGGTVISVAKTEVYVDLDGLRTGVVRGKEIADESGTFANLKVGDRVEATVLELENELGVMELSFRTAGHKKAWDQLAVLQGSGQTVAVKVLGANKGGLLVSLERVTGFLPVSQLSSEHYPRVIGGDKQKILEKLLTFVGSNMDVKVLDLNEAENKLIVSEKRVVSEKQGGVLAGYAVGDVVEGTVSGITPFGAFVRFGENLEGLVHISELAWQRIDNPADIVKIGEVVKARIIGMDGSKISLSRKQLLDDPWKNVAEKYHVGDVVSGKVLKMNLFGLFVELDPDIHGLAHISELAAEPVRDPAAVAQIGQTMEFKIISLDPSHHRLGLSRRAMLMDTTAPASAEPTAPAPTTEPLSDASKPESPSVIASDALERSLPSRDLPQGDNPHDSEQTAETFSRVDIAAPQQ